MTGPEHYREAERLLARVDDDDVARQAKAIGASAEAYVAVMEHTVAKAQVHATLALAAATAINAPMPNSASTRDMQAWRTAAGVPPQRDPDDPWEAPRP